MSYPKRKKDPDAVIEFGQDWGTGAVIDGVTADWLADDETITTSEWFITGADTDLTIDSDSHDDKTTTVWLSGGTAGVNYTLTNRITTDGGRTDDRSRIIQVVER